MKLICVICGAEYSAPPSDKRSTCGKPECVRERKRQTHQGKHNEWSAEARTRLAAKGRTANLRLGTPAAQESPIAGSFETNQEAKLWWVLGPDGQRYTIRNLRLWCKENEELFWPDAWQLAYAGLRQVQAWLMGRTRRKVGGWKGWTLERPAEPPP